MEFLKRSWVEAQAFFSQLSMTARWLIGCLLIIFILIGWLMLQYVAKPDMLPITQFAGERQPEVAARLQAAGIDVQTQAGQLLVRADHYNQAMVALVNSDLLAADTAEAFDQLIARQSPWQSNAQNAQAFLLAKQKVLSQIVGKMVGVRSASVLLSMPDKQGFGATYVRPSASVNIVMRGSKRVDKRLVDAAAGLVSGAIAEMEPQDVVVVDANHGRQFTVKSPNDILPGETLELVQQLEQRYRDKITEVLGYIPGVIIAVNVRIDPVRTKRIEEYNYEETEPLKTEFTREIERRDTQDSGEPGARPNTGLDIAGGASTGSLETINEARNEFNEKNLTRRTQTTETGHTTKQVSVTVNVPRSYFVGVLKQANPDDDQDPDDDTLKPIIDQQLVQIEAQVEPLIIVDQNSGTVRAHMIPDRDKLLAITGMTGVVSAQSGISGFLESSWAKPVGLALLAMMSLAIMFGMVRKASQIPELPNAQELAGVPPQLPGDDSVAGEASEADDTMLGIELTEEELEVRRIADQIADMISENPQESASLVNRWIMPED